MVLDDSLAGSSQRGASMDQENQPTNPTSLPPKRKRGRPRKDNIPVSELSARTQQRRRANPPSDVPVVDLVGQTVFGTLNGVFDAGYLITVRAGLAGPVLSGLVFDPRLVPPMTAENDIAPHLPMLRRSILSVAEASDHPGNEPTEVEAAAQVAEDASTKIHHTGLPLHTEKAAEDYGDGGVVSHLRQEGLQATGEVAGGDESNSRPSNTPKAVQQSEAETGEVVSLEGSSAVVVKEEHRHPGTIQGSGERELETPRDVGPLQMGDSASDARSQTEGLQATSEVAGGGKSNLSPSHAPEAIQQSQAETKEVVSLEGSSVVVVKEEEHHHPGTFQGSGEREVETPRDVGPPQMGGSLSDAITAGTLRSQPEGLQATSEVAGGGKSNLSPSHAPEAIQQSQAETKEVVSLEGSSAVVMREEEHRYPGTIRGSGEREVETPRDVGPPQMGGSASDAITIGTSSSQPGDLHAEYKPEPRETRSVGDAGDDASN